MMLSDIDIEAAMQAGQLVISPYFQRSLEAAGVTLHLGYDILKPLAGKTVDVKHKILPDYQPITMADDKPYCLMPQEFVLGHTYENITVGNQLGFFIEGRSTLARLGLTVVKTAMLVQPGHCNRTVTLELANHGPNPLLLYPKMKIAKAALFQLNSATSRAYDANNGKYRTQSTVGKPVFTKEFLEEE